MMSAERKAARRCARRTSRLGARRAIRSDVRCAGRKSVVGALVRDACRGLTACSSATFRPVDATIRPLDVRALVEFADVTRARVNADDVRACIDIPHIKVVLALERIQQRADPLILLEAIIRQIGLRL